MNDDVLESLKKRERDVYLLYRDELIKNHCDRTLLHSRLDRAGIQVAESLNARIFCSWSFPHPLDQVFTSSFVVNHRPNEWDIWIFDSESHALYEKLNKQYSVKDCFRSILAHELGHIQGANLNQYLYTNDKLKEPSAWAFGKFLVERVGATHRCYEGIQALVA